MRVYDSDLQETQMYLLLAQNDAGQTPATGAAATGAVRRLAELKDHTLDFIQVNGVEFVINLLIAGIIYYVGKIAAHVLTRIVRRGLQRTKVDPMLVRFLENILYALLLVMVVMAALSQLGIETTSLAAVLAAAGFAIGMALQGSLGNLASGVMLIVFRPFKAGDFVEAAGTKGIVEEIEIFNTILRTPDNVRVIVPNGQITGSVITNYAARETRRIDLVIGCSYGDDIRQVKAFLTQIVTDEPRILEDPEPLVAVDALAESSINFVVRPWVKTDDYWAVKWDLTEQIKLGFDERGFNFPFPSRDVYVHQEKSAT
jgi:small conductance mechanosensitive channel